MKELTLLTQNSMNIKFIHSLISITKTRAEDCWKYSRDKNTMSGDDILYRGKARAYGEMTELLESLLKRKYD